MSKFKVGDKVRVREDLEVGKYYGCYLNKEMAELKGKVVEIEDVGNESYSIKGDIHYWSEEMFSELAEPRNLIPLIAKELGVEIGEEFAVSSGASISEEVYEFDEYDLFWINNGRKHKQYHILYHLLTNDLTIKKLPPKPKLTEDEKAILRNLPKKYKYIARDKYGELYVYKNKPKKESDGWVNYSYDTLRLFQSLFQFIKWGDDEPYKIQELLEEYENLRSE